MNRDKLAYKLGQELQDQVDVVQQQCPSETNLSLLHKYHPEVVLYQPQIPQNTGSIARLCAALCSTLHLIQPMPFEITQKSVLRAGLDYWEFVNLYVHKNYTEFRKVRSQRRAVFVETGGEQTPYEFSFLPGDLLIFGAETFGIPKNIMEQETPLHKLTIPMFQKGVRSLNLANSVSIVLYMAVAQLHQRNSKC